MNMRVLQHQNLPCQSQKPTQTYCKGTVNNLTLESMAVKILIWKEALKCHSGFF